MSTWWRAYNNSIHHKKLLKLSDVMHRAWYTLNCIAADNDGTLPAAVDIAVTLRMKPEKVAEWIAKLVSAELYDNNDGIFSPHNWDTRQYKTDAADPTGAKRAKKYRDNKRDASRRVTRDDAVRDERPEAEQSRIRSEAEQTRAAVSKIGEGKGEQSDLALRVLKTDLMEAFGAKRCPDLSRASDWLTKGYAPSTCVEVVRELLARKPDISSLAYFDAALADRHSKRGPTPSERAAGVSPETMDWALGHFAKGGHWSRQVGPEPGQPGCRATPEMLAKHGLGLDGQKLTVSA